jgi:hypothetical protein
MEASRGYINKRFYVSLEEKLTENVPTYSVRTLFLSLAYESSQVSMQYALQPTIRQNASRVQTSGEFGTISTASILAGP